MKQLERTHRWSILVLTNAELREKLDVHRISIDETMLDQCLDAIAYGSVVERAAMVDKIVRVAS